MSSLLRSKPKSNTKKVLGIGVFILVIFISLQFFFPHFLTSTTLSVARPLWSVRDATVSSFSGFFNFFSFKSTLRNENENLREELFALRVREYEFNQMKIEYESLKALLGDTATSSIQSHTLARILSKPPFTPYDSFVVDKGSEQGVSVGDVVYTNNALTIGRITSVSPDTSFVTLFSSGGEEQEFGVGRTGVSVKVLGKGSGNFEIYIPKDFDIEIGDTLTELSSDVSIVAVVYAIDESSQNSFKRVYARVPTAIFQSKWVLIDN